MQVNRLKILAGIVLFGSVWGMTECILGSMELPGALGYLPMGAVLGGFFGLGIMAFSRRLYGIHWMQLGIAVVAGLLRFWAPVGTCVICSGLAIMCEGLVFEIIFNRPSLDFVRRPDIKNLRMLAFLGIVSGYIIYVVGYMFTQVATPIATTGTFHPSDFAANLPLMFGRGFFAAIFGAIALPAALLVESLDVNVATASKKLYYGTAAGMSVFCWVLVIAVFHL
jgi:hypothetical protein